MTDSEILVIKAIISFDKKANELVNILADKYALDLTLKNPFDKLLKRQNDLWKGELPDNWIYQFHGGSCKFENVATKQYIDISILNGANYGAIDNYFLHKYIETTEDLKDISDIINSAEILNKTLAQLEKDDIIINVGDPPFNYRILNYQSLPDNWTEKNAL